MARDYQREFKENCLTCKKYDIYDKGSVTVRGYRCKRLMRQVALDEHCYQHDFDALRSNRTLEDAVDFILRRGYDPRPDCYVTTACCEILGLGINHEYIANFRKLRDGYMATFPEGQRQLDKYDIYGVQIADKMHQAYNDPQTKDSLVAAVRDVFEPCYLKTVGQMIQAGNFELATYTYFQMIEMLAKRYQIEYTVEEANIEDLCEGCTRGGALQNA